LRRARLHQDIEIDQRNRARMKYIEISGRKMKFSP
jgi:hypothetical protein